MPGFRQRQAQADARERSRSPVLLGAGSLRSWLSEWAWGSCSAAQVVRNAATYLAEHDCRAVDPRVRRLAQTELNLNNAQRVINGILGHLDLVETVPVNGGASFRRSSCQTPASTGSASRALAASKCIWGLRRGASGHGGSSTSRRPRAGIIAGCTHGCGGSPPPISSGTCRSRSSTTQARCLTQQARLCVAGTRSWAMAARGRPDSSLGPA